MAVVVDAGEGRKGVDMAGSGSGVLVVPPFDCAWLMSDELRLADGGRGCVAFEARAENDVTVVFKEHAGCKHYRTDTGPNYTVVLGSHRNRRLKIEVDGRAVVDVPGSLLCPSLFERYWISVHDGLITVGKGDPGKGAVHRWLDAHPKCNLRYVGLSSWDKHVAYRNIRVLPTSLIPAVPPVPRPDHLGLSQFLESLDLADARFLVGATARVVPSHRVLLHACSPLPAVASEAIVLPDVDHRVLRALLEYIYLGRTKISVSRVLQLQRLAQEFGPPSLLQCCQQHLAEHSSDPSDSLLVEFTCPAAAKCVDDSFTSCGCLREPAVAEKLRRFREEGHLCDVDLLVDGYGKVARAHKLVLSAWSAPFAKMFNNGMFESNKSQVSITDVTPAPFKAMIDFLYTGEVDSDGALLLPLLFLADQFGISALREECCDRLLECLTEDSVTVILQVAAELPGCDSLRDACEECFAKHFDYCTVPPALEFRELEGECLMRILQHPDVWVSAEERVLDAVLTWGANKDGICSWGDACSHLELPTDGLFQERSEELQLMLQLVRFPLMPVQLLEKLQSSSVSKHLPVVHELVSEALDYLGQEAITSIRERDASHKVDVKTQGRLVKIQTRSIRFNRRLSAYKELMYMSDGDRNGVFYYAGTSYGIHSWMNPAVIKTITVTASSPPSRYTDPKALVSGNYQGTSFASPCTVNGVTSAWWKVDLGEDHQLMCNYYTLRQDGSTNFPRSWSLQGSTDGLVWIELRTHENDQTICHPGQYASWPVYGGGACFPFRCFRIVLTGPTRGISHSWNLCLCYMELYGYFR